MKPALIATALILASTSALADGNSLNGPGWASVAKDIHTTRIEQDLRGPETADFARQGLGPATVNRYIVPSTTARGAARAEATAGRNRR